MLKRKECQNLIIETVKANIGNKAFRRIITGDMRDNHGVMNGRTLQLINGNDGALDAASVEELYWLCSAFELALDGKVTFDEYFTDSEKALYKNSKVKKDDEDVYPVVFKK